jgi:hypothetical protein
LVHLSTYLSKLKKLINHKMTYTNKLNQIQAHMEINQTSQHLELGQ